MKKILIVFVIVMFPVLSIFAQQKTVEEFKLKEYFFVMLKKGPNRNQEKTEVAKLQEGHMAHLNKMAKDGKICIAGPFGDDGDWRGILIFKTKTSDEAKALVEQDPMIKAGRLSYEIHPWWSEKGAKLD